MIAFLINDLNIRGGTQKQFLKLLEYAEQQRVDFFVVAKNIDYDNTYPGFFDLKDKIRIFPDIKEKNMIGYIKYIIRLRKLVHDASVINIHDYGFEYFLPAFIGKRVVWQINDLPRAFNIGILHSKKQPFENKLKFSYIRLSMPVVNDITVNVSKNAERIRRSLRRDSHVFYCGIEPTNENRIIENTFRRFDERKINILTSGVFFPYRNYETQVAVVKELRNRDIDARLDIIGATVDKNYYQLIKSLISNEKLDDYITICGQISEEQ